MKMMRLNETLTSLLLLLASPVIALNVILNNDDSWASAQIRELYIALNNAGHNAWIVAPATDQSGHSGTVDFSPSSTLTTAGAYSSLPSGKPSFGTEPDDPKIWYYDGSPAACTFFALDYVVPNHWNGSSADLVVTGPNFGTNMGPYMYTYSGTLAAAYTAVGRGIPAIAFSASSNSGGNRGYQDIYGTTKTGYPDPAIIIANLSTSLVNQLSKNAGNSASILPQGYGISVNLPEITSLDDTSCLFPPFIYTRMTGLATTTKAKYDSSSGTFSIENTVPADGDGLNAAINVPSSGNGSLPAESEIVNNNCQTSLTLFTVDYSAPLTSDRDQVVQMLGTLVTSEADAQNYSSSTATAGPGPTGSDTVASASSTRTGAASSRRNPGVIWGVGAVMGAVGFL